MKNDYKKQVYKRITLWCWWSSWRSPPFKVPSYTVPILDAFPQLSNEPKGNNWCHESFWNLKSIFDDRWSIIARLKNFFTSSRRVEWWSNDTERTIWGEVITFYWKSIIDNYRSVISRLKKFVRLIETSGLVVESVQTDHLGRSYGECHRASRTHGRTHGDGITQNHALIIDPPTRSGIKNV